MNRLIPMAVLLVALTPACANGGPTTPGRHPGHDLVWSQAPADTNMSWATQFAADYPFWIECATDFVAPENTEITHIHWWGQWWRSRSAPTVSVVRTRARGGGRPDLVCSGAELRSCNVVIDDTNVGAPSNADLYGGVWEETGPEVVYELQIPFAGTTMTAALSDMSADLDIFLLPDCDETTFLHAENDTLAWTFAEPGIYYLVVEGYDGAESSYTLTIDCDIVPETYFSIRFYADLAVGRGRSVPGAILYEHHTINYNEGTCSWPVGFCYWADIPGFPIVEGERYWVSVQCARDFWNRIQWGWGEAETVVGGSGVMDSALHGYPRWTSMAYIAGRPTDFAVELADIETTVEARSWGVIKSLYR